MAVIENNNSLFYLFYILLTFIVIMDVAINKRFGYAALYSKHSGADYHLFNLMSHQFIKKAKKSRIIIFTFFPIHE